MNLSVFLDKWDNGAGFSGRPGDRVLADSEIKARGGTAAFIVDVRQLAPREQRSVSRMLRENATRDAVDGAIDPAFARFMQDFDRNKSHQLDRSEIADGAFQRFRTSARSLPPDTRRRIADRIPNSVFETVGAPLHDALPETANPRDFGSVRALTRADRELADTGRTFVRETLRLDPNALTDGLRRSHLGPDTVPATPAEAIARDLRTEIGDQSLSLADVGRFVGARASRRSVTLSVQDLARGLAEQPQRFEHNRYVVTGYAEQISRRTGKDLTYSFMKDEWVRVPYTEAMARLGEQPGATGASIQLFERQEGSTLLSGFWISMSSPQTAALNAAQRVQVEGVIRRQPGDTVYRLDVGRYQDAQ